MKQMQLSTGMTIWKARKQHAFGSKAAALYWGASVLVVCVAPLARLVWIWLVGPAGSALMLSPIVPAVLATLVALGWIGVLFLGTHVGPALLPPLLVYAFGTSPLQRSAVFRSQIVGKTLGLAGAFASAAAVLGAALLSLGVGSIWGLLGFVVTMACAGVITGLLWIVGQSYPRTAKLIAIAIATGLAASDSHPLALIHWLPWGWVGGSYPTGLFSLPAFSCTIALTLLLTWLTPRVINSLRIHEVMHQALRFETATAHIYSFDVASISRLYETMPQLGRSLRPVISARRLSLMFLIRDAIGLIRTPGRLLAGSVSAIAAGVLVALASLPALPAAPLAMSAALMLLAASGKLGQNVRHAAEVSAGSRLYGVSDLALIAYHSLFPFLAISVLSSGSLLITISLCSLPIFTPLCALWGLALLIGALRLSSTLRGPVPLALMTPMPTPVGDFSILMQLAWVWSDGVLAVLSGFAFSLFPFRPIPLLILSVVVAGLVIARWKTRR